MFCISNLLVICDFVLALSTFGEMWDYLSGGGHETVNETIGRAFFSLNKMFQFSICFEFVI